MAKERGKMPEGTAPRPEREVDRFAPRFTDAVKDPSDDEEYDDEEYGDDDEDYADDEDIDFKEAFGLPDRLPPMRLPSAAELAAMARGASLIGQLRAFAAWLGTGRAVTENADLPADELSEVAAALGLDVPSATDEHALPAPPAVGRMRDVPRLDYLWRLALDAEFIDLDDDETHAIPGEVAQAWQDGDDDEVLDIWEMVFALVMGTLDIVASLDPRRSRELDFFGQGAALAVMLFLARDGLPVAEVSEAIRSAAVDELAPARAAKAWQSWVRAHGDPARLLLDRMAELGAVRISDSDDGDLARLTPLGLAALRTQFIDSGVEIPLLPPVEEMTAADLIAMADSAAEDEFQAETAAWLVHRTPESAARDLLSVAAESDPASRVLAVAVVTELGVAAEPAWRDALGRLELRGYAKATLATLAGDPAAAVPSGFELPNDDLAWMLIDALVVHGFADVDDDDGHEPAALAERLGEAIPAGRELAAFEMMARVPHPDAASVLTVIGRHHPDKKIAKLARKSAYKAASRQAARPG